MPSTIGSPVPSRAALRFLRAQSGEIPFVRRPCRSLPRGRSQAVTCSPPSARLADGAIAGPSHSGLATTTTRRVLTPPGQHRLVQQSPLLLRPRRARAAASPSSTFPPSAAFHLSASTLRYNVSCDSSSPNKPRVPTWQERLWGLAARRGSTPLQSDDLPNSDSIDNNTMFNSRRTQAAKAALEPRLRCTEVNEDGEVILVDGEFKKTELIAKYGLLPRDLRKIDSSNLPHILVRPSAILLNLLHLKVLIKSDRVLLFDVYGSKTSYPQSAFMYDLQGKLQQKNTASSGGLPYEFRALEAVLTSVTSELEADFETVRDPVIRILSELEDDIDRHKLRLLLILSKRVSTFEQKVKLVRDAIEELLEADDDLSAMYLTEKRHDLYRGVDDHTEVELLLESYHKLCDEVVQEAGSLVSSIRNTEEIIRAILDANRNALMLLDLKFSIGTLGLAMGTFMAGLYGMNLENFIEETNWGFGSVTAVSVVFSLIVCWYGLGKLRRVQRVKMMGDERSNLPRPQTWLLEGPGGLMDARSRERMRKAGTRELLKKK